MSEKSQLLVFDVDGVLSGVFEDVIKPDVLARIALRMAAGDRVAFNSGRGSEYIIRNVIDPLQGYELGPTGLGGVVVMSEMGGERTTFEQGVPITCRTEFSMNAMDMDTAKQIVRAGDFKTLEIEEEKQTMVTAKIIRGSQPAAFLGERNLLRGQLERTFAGKHVEIITTEGSIDLFQHGAGKRGGAIGIADWLVAKTVVRPESCVCFGDSWSDYAMAEHFAKIGMQTTFVYTGQHAQQPRGVDGVPVVVAEGLYTAGTIAYLDSMSRA